MGLPMKTRMQRIGLPLALVTGLLLLLLWLLWGQALLPDTPDRLWQIEAEAGCDLHHGACVARLDDGGMIEFRITPQPIRMLTPLQLEVRLHGLQAKGVLVDFNGVEMDMGFNRPRLQLQADGGFAGNGMLPLCVYERMTWQALVLIETDAGLGVARFYFDTTRRPS